MLLNTTGIKVAFSHWFHKQKQSKTLNRLSLRTGVVKDGALVSIPENPKSTVCSNLQLVKIEEGLFQSTPRLFNHTQRRELFFLFTYKLNDQDTEG